MKHRYVITVTAAALIVQGCSSRPRAFAPTLAAAPPEQASFDQAAFDQTYATCTQMLVAGKLDQSGKLASAGVGAAASGAAMAAGTASAAAVAGYSGLAVLGATIVLLPFVAIGGAVGMAKMKRAKKEKAIKIAMTGCLAERGYAVTSWEKIAKKREREAVAPAPGIAAPIAPR